MTLENVMEDSYTPIWDVIGIVNGTHEDEVIIVGNHRDSWVVGGAGDPNSGSAVLIALSEALGYLLKAGWQPRRTIVLASWDMEEYGLVGSTEVVDEYLPWLSTAAVTYINVDIATSGPIPHVSATPELHDLAITCMKKVIWPRAPNQTLYDVWAWHSGDIGVLGGGSDYTAFVHNGVSAIDIGAHGGKDDPTYHYHSNFDSYHWMTKFGDPGFQVHVAMGQWLSLLTYHLADDQIIPFNMTTYVVELRTYYDDLKEVIKKSECCFNVDIRPIDTAIDAFNVSASAIAGARYQAIVQQDQKAVSEINWKYKTFQRAFVSQGALPGRDFFKHTIFAPGVDTGYTAVTFPGITEAITISKDPALAAEWVHRASGAITLAAQVLSGDAVVSFVDGKLDIRAPVNPTPVS